MLSNKSEVGADPLVPTVFHEPWWLSAASNGAYEHVEVSDGHHVIGRFPYVVSHRLGRSVSTLPPLTHVLGPAVDEGTGSANTRFLRRYTVTRELIAKLPTLHRFRQKLHRGYPEALSFQSQGFQTGVQFTFEIEPQPEMDAWNKLRNKTRNVIRRAQEELAVSEMNDAETFLRLYKSNMAVRGRRMVQPRDEVAAVCTAALEHNAGKIFCARDKHQNLIAAVFLAFDLKTAYYLMSTRASDSGNGAISLLIWTGICFCIERKIVFNFDGIGSEGSVLLYAGFGGQPKPTYIVSKESKRIRCFDFCRRAIRGFPKENFFDRY